MKKFFGILTVVLCICFVLAMPVSAAGDPMAEKFQEELDLLDHFYDYDYHYMIRIASDKFISWDDDDMWKPVTVPAEEFDAVLKEHFVITDNQIQELRELGNRDYNTDIWDDDSGEIVEVIPFFNADTQTYTFQFYGGFGGSLPDREYLGYIHNGETYDVYYRHISYGYLSDVLPDGVDEWEYAESLEWPAKIEYDGVVYQDGPEGYYTILSYDDFGRKYTVEMNGEIVRIISCVNYTEDEQPESFDDIYYDIPEGDKVEIPSNDCFEGNTTVKVEEIVSGDLFDAVADAMASVAEKFVAFEFTATKDNVAVQPSGKLVVVFALPDGYSNDVTVYYLNADGNLEALQGTVNSSDRTVSVELEHFSTYILADNATKPHQHEYKAVLTAPTCTEKGYTTFTCDCGDSYVADEVDATDHSFGEWTQSKAPTESEEGEEKRVCANCDHFETRTVDKLPKPDATDKPNTPEDTKPVTTAPTEDEADEEDEDDTDGEGENLGVIIAVIAAVAVAAVVVVIALIRKKK
ncbi:MAG: hypothetical protein IJW98_06405 [Clostridia bacterium]|nr:hypothetical protein [Clostridia bacterium]